MQNKKILAKVLCIVFSAGFMSFAPNDICSYAFADDLRDVNIADYSPREYVFDSFDTVYTVEESTGLTAPYFMSVIGKVNNDKTIKSIIDYGGQYSGFIVDSGISLNLRNLLIKNTFSDLSGSFLYNNGIANLNNVDLTGNSVVSTGVATGGAIYNTGQLTISGNLINNSITSVESKNAGAIYTTSNVTLTTDGDDLQISGNTVISNGTEKQQAIYVDNIDATLTINAQNGGSWVIDDIIDGKNDRISGTYYRYNVDLTGDMNSVIKLNNKIENANVSIKDINLFIANNTFSTSAVNVEGDTIISLSDNNTADYSFASLKSDAQGANPNFEFEVWDTSDYDTLSVGAPSAGAVKVHNIVFLDGIKEGSYRFLRSNSSNLDKLYLTLESGEDTGEGSFTNVSSSLNWDSDVHKYSYDMTLSTTSTYHDTVDITGIVDEGKQDNLNSLNTYRTKYDRHFIFNNYDNVYEATTNSGLNANLSSLSIEGVTDGAGKYSVIDYKGYSGIDFGIGSNVIVSNVAYRGAKTSSNGSVFNLNNSNSVLDYTNGQIGQKVDDTVMGNFANGSGGAVYMLGNSFMNLNNVDFSYNTAGVSGGAIYVYSDGNFAPFVTNIKGNFTQNSSIVSGGAIVNYTDYSRGQAHSLISSITGDFTQNSVNAIDTDANGGAIYNTGEIQYITGDFVENSAASQNGNSFGGAISNSYVRINGQANKGSISNITSSFIDNCAIAENGIALGGAIYTTNDLRFYSLDELNPVEFSGNYVLDASGKKSNAIFADTTYGNVNLNFNISNGATLNIKDSFDGGNIADGVVTRGGTTTYKLTFQGGEGGAYLNFTDVKDYTTGETLNGLVNANVNVSDVNLVSGERTFADENTTVRIEKSIFSAKDGEYKNYVFNKLTSLSTTEYLLDFRAYKNGDEAKFDYDTITVYGDSTGTIKITDLGINRDEFFEVANYIAQNTQDGFVTKEILKRLPDSSGVVGDIKIEMVYEIPDNPEYTTIKKDYKTGENEYTVQDNSFIGTIGFALNDTKDSFIIGILTREDPLSAINRFTDEDIKTTRIFNMTGDLYTSREDIGETAIGKFTVNGNNAVFNIAGKKGFYLASKDTQLILNNLHLNYANLGLESNAVDVPETDSEGNPYFSVILNNVKIYENEESISNIKGRIKLNNVEFATPETRQNTLRNDDYIYVTSDSDKSSKLYSSIKNDGIIELSGNTYIGKDDNHLVQISGLGSVVTSSDAIYTDMRFARLVNLAQEGGANSFTLNSGKLTIGRDTFASSVFTHNNGIVDLSMSQDGTIGVIDQPFNINTYISNSDSAGFILDIDFASTTSPSDVINVGDNSEGVVRILAINGFETLDANTPVGAKSQREITLLNAPSNVTLDLTNALDGHDFFKFYIDYYNYTITDDFFVGEVHLESTDRGVLVKKNPVYDGIVELNQMSKYPGEVDYSKDRKFIFTQRSVDKAYELPVNMGSTKPGVYIVTTSDALKEANVRAKMNMAKFGGFEIDSPEKTLLTVENVEITGAGTKGYNEYRPIDEDVVIDFTERSEKRGSVIFMNSTDSETTATLKDVIISDNFAEGLGGAVYSKNNVTVIAENMDTIFSQNYQNKNDTTPTGAPNDIYMDANREQTLNLYARNGHSINLLSGLATGDKSLLNLNINDGSENAGTVKIVLPQNIGSATQPIAKLSLNGGTFDLNDGKCNTIYASDLVVNADTKYNFDVDLMRGESDKIATDKVKENKGDGVILISKDNFNYIDGMMPDVDSIRIKLLDVRSESKNFIQFYEIDEETGEIIYTDGLVLYYVDDKPIYAKMGLNGSMIAGFDPDCSSDPLVQAIFDTKNKTYKLYNEPEIRKNLYNYGTGNFSGVVYPKKFTLKGDTYSTIYTPNEIEGFVIKDTPNALGSKKTFTASNFIISGFKSAFVNYGGKIKLTKIDLLENETDGDGSGIKNVSGSLSYNGKKKNYSNAFNNLTARYGGVVYNSGTFSTNYVNYGKATDKRGSYENTADVGGAIYNTGKATIKNSYFVNNDADSKAGAVYAGGTTKLTSDNFRENESVLGGAIYVNSSPEKKITVSISKNNFYENKAGENGGAIYVEKGKVNISTSNFGSATEKGNSAINGGALYVGYKALPQENVPYNVTTVKSSKFANNNATNGGVIYNAGKLNSKSNTYGLTDKAGNKYYNEASNGAVVYNSGNFTDKSSKFYYNKATSRGGAVYNTGDIVTYNSKNVITGGLTSSKFAYNEAREGGAIYNENLLGVSKSTFTENKATRGGAVYNTEDADTTVISSKFYQNAGGEAGGAIYNEGVLRVQKSNFGKSPSKTVSYDNTAINGGAVYNSGTTIITGSTFVSNNAMTGSGGAIYVDDNSVLSINSSSFKNNVANNGGAIYVGEKSFVQISDTSFTNNIANNAGGALYLDSDSITNIFAIKKNVSFSNNKAGEKSNAIHMNNATLNLQANKGRKITINDYISGVGEITTSGNVIIKEETAIAQDSEITFNHNGTGTLVFENEDALINMKLSLSANAGTSIANNKIGTLALKSLSLADDTTSNFAIDIDLKNGESDKVTAESVEGTGAINVSKVNLTSDSKTPVTINVGEGSLVDTMSATSAETKEATYKLKSSLDENGILRATAYRQKAKPCTLAAPVAAQLGGYLTQINSYDQAFMNMDLNMTKTLDERTAEMSARHAELVSASHGFGDKTLKRVQGDIKLAYSPQFDNGMNRNGKGLWTRPYVTFERVNLSHGPKVGSISYGNFFGGDADIKHLNNGWKRQFSAYVGYNGSTLDFNKQSIDQNGGTIGVTEVWYKNNFFTGLTANVSANAVNASTDLGHENFPMLMAGVASKTGYNFEFKKGKFILQPSLLLSYSFVHTFAHNNGLGHRVSSSPLHAIQVAPGVKFIFNLPKGWQPYLAVNMRWNIIDKTHFSLPDVSIPDMSINPYVEYGVGIQRKWGERFTGFGQALIRNGGRNGVMLSFGLKWAIGK